MATAVIASVKLISRSNDRPCLGSTGLGVLKAEADLHGDLNVIDVPILDVAPDVCDLEPIQMPDGLRGPIHGIPNRSIDPVRAGTHDLGEAICATAHGLEPTPP